MNSRLLVQIEIQVKPERTEFLVFQTPVALWEALPTLPQAVEMGTAPLAPRFKRLSAKWQGRTYEATFYRTTGETG